MNQHWPSYYHPNDYFWNHEWLKHGTCANVTISQFTYFSNTLQIYSKMHLVDVLKKASIIPSHGSYSKQRMEDALKSAGFPGVIACTRDKTSIEEIRFCVNRDSLQFMECDQALINDIHTHNPCKDTISYPPIH
ncbi:hypothetical protein C9374_001240 [Naegleria lovaniensis]|uniref:Uncharacterized protein n=1 Tax=Naegleria lovaniensis TaxID=51637 RepID=A0AA88GSN4_NAELO|nr:uncharacterized protein C9374_001240 [Naegleria lovaniensis]KAG2387646.1 hypothetical protein C9374_001240 [Naegleria lovaniensis]